MAISAVIAAISTASAVIGAGGISAFTFAGFSAGFASVAASFLVTTAMGVALNALTPKPNLGAASRGYNISGQSGSALDHQIVYGEARVGGVRVYDAATGGNNEFLHRILAFAGHEIDSYQEIYLNDEIVTLDGSGNVTSPSQYNGFVRIKTYLGTTTQTADPDLVAETASLTDGIWTNDHRLQNIAYVYVRFKYNQDAFPNGVPSLSVKIRGKKVFNPDTSTTAWSSNPALCVRDYLTSAYGLAQPSSRIDDALVIAAANICDQTVDSEDRYTCNGAFTTGAAPSDILTNLLSSMGGLLWYGQGKWRMKASAWTAPTVSFDENDLRSGISLSTRHSRRDNFNSVKGTFAGDETEWQVTDYPQVSDPAFLAADNNLPNVLDFSLPFTSSSKTARRVARIALNRNREQLTFSASFGMRAFQVQVGDFINITNTRFGWTNKAFEVVEWTFGLTDGLDIQVNMTLREISEGVFTEAPGVTFEQNNTTLPNPFRPVPVGLALDSEVRIVNEHLTNVIFANVTSSEPFNIERVEVQFKKSSETTWKIAGVGDLGIFEILDTEDETYDIRARSYSVLGIKSDFVTFTNFVVAGLAFPPADVTGFTAEINGASIHLEWEPVPDLDLSFYRIRHAVEESGASWANATTVVDKAPRPGNSFTVPAKPGTYMIRAFDKTGNASGNYTSVVIPSAALESFTNTLTQTEDPTFSGTKTDCSVSGSNLIITDVTGTAPFLATYEFSNYIDTGSVRRFRSRIDVANTRQDNSAGLWDDIPGLFDSLPGNFDDFTGAAQFADTNVVTYISTTDDDPAGTPTWTAYKKFRAGDYYARAARFKIELTSTSQDVTPSISQLDAIVEYN
jgi:hypothetical protein